MLPWASHQAMHGGDPASRPGRRAAGTDSIIYRHGKRNVPLRFDGILPIVCPAADDSQFSGLAVFAGSLDPHLSGNRAGPSSRSPGATAFPPIAPKPRLRRLR